MTNYQIKNEAVAEMLSAI